MGRYYDEFSMPAELRRNFDVYDRIRELKIPLGTWEENVRSLAGANIAGAVVAAAGLVYLSGVGTGKLPMQEDAETIRHGQHAGQEAADHHIRGRHQSRRLICAGTPNLTVLYNVRKDVPAFLPRA